MARLNLCVALQRSHEPLAALHEAHVALDVLMALPAESLLAACCLCRVWKIAESADRSALWRALVFKWWPALACLPATSCIDWQQRYRVLLQHGTEYALKIDPLSLFSFVLQGRWEGSEAPAFSQLATASRTARSVEAGDSTVEILDALQLELELDAAIPLPPSWLAADPATDEPAAGYPAADGLEITILVHARASGKVAHLLSLSIRKESIFPRESIDPRPDEMWPEKVLRDWDFHALPNKFKAKVDTRAFPTNAGCGLPKGPQRQRADVPWLSEAASGGIDLSSVASAPIIEVDPATINFRVEEAVPRLSGICIQPNVIFEIHAVHRAIFIPLQAGNLSGLLDLLYWS